MDNFEIYKKVVQERDKANENSLKTQSKDRLLSIMEKKLTTAFIGALDQFEKLFGFLWQGNGQEHKDMLSLWKLVRTNILNNGNNQIRAIQNEIQHYDVKWNRYHVDLKVKN